MSNSACKSKTTIKQSKASADFQNKLGMALSTSTAANPLVLMFLSFIFLSLFTSSSASHRPADGIIPPSDIDLLEFPLNLEYLEAEFFLWGSLGRGLDNLAPNLTGGGPSPIGAKIANLDHLIRDIIAQFAFQEVGHLR